MANLVNYVKTVWENGKTALNAARINNMEQGISNCATQINKLGNSVSRYKYGTIAAKVEANSVGTYEVNLGGTPKVTFANAMSANKGVRAQAKSADNGKAIVVVINGESHVWEGSVSWFAII